MPKKYKYIRVRLDKDQYHVLFHLANENKKDIPNIISDIVDTLMYDIAVAGNSSNYIG